MKYLILAILIAFQPMPTVLGPADLILAGDVAGDYNGDGFTNGLDVQHYADARVGRVYPILTDAAQNADLSGAAYDGSGVWVCRQNRQAWYLRRVGGRWETWKTITFASGVGGDIEGMAVAGGLLYCLDEDTGKVSRCRDDGFQINSWIVPMPRETNGAGPEGLAIMRHNDAPNKITAYIAHQAGGGIYEADLFDNGDVGPVTMHPMPMPESCSCEIVNDVLYVLHGDNFRCVTRWEIGEKQLTMLGGGFDCPLSGCNVEGLAVTTYGRVWTVDGAPNAGPWFEPLTSWGAN